MSTTPVAPLWRRAATGLVAATTLASGLTACAGDAASATAVVEGYLSALARGDAAAALAFGEPDPASGPLLTGDALAASLAQAPLTVNLVGGAEVAGDTAQVGANYTLGERNVSYVFTLTRRPDGWRVDHAYATVRFSGRSSWLENIGDGSVVGLTVNGVPVTAETDIALFPGVYQLGATNPLVTLTGGKFNVLTPDDQIDQYSGQQPQDVAIALTPDAQRQLGIVARTTLQRCLAEHTLNTSCGIDDQSFGARSQVVDSSAVWSIEPTDIDPSVVAASC